MPIGYISYIDEKGSYGFIDSPDINQEHIFFHQSNLNKSYKHSFKGDKVTFDLQKIDKDKEQAVNINFINNVSIDSLKNDFEEQIILKGYLKKINNRYYVKDSKTYVFIRLLISENEIFIQEKYEDRLNQLVEFRIISIPDKNKLRAVINDREFISECYLLLQNNPIIGEVIEVVKSGYKLKIFGKVFGFLSNTSVNKLNNILKVGDLINVVCINIENLFDHFSFDLIQNIEYKQNLEIEKQNFLTSMQVGNRYIGKVKEVKGFGVFISLEYCDCLLHIKRIISNDFNLPKIEKKEFDKILSEIFKKRQEIEVIIEDITDKDKISLTWDITTKTNSMLYNEINSNYWRLKTSAAEIE
jgi:ribosomal protein S1